MGEASAEPWIVRGSQRPASVASTPARAIGGHVHGIGSRSSDDDGCDRELLDRGLEGADGLGN